MASIKKPNFKNAKQTIKKIQDTDRQLCALHSTKERYENEIRANYSAMRSELAKKELDDMDIEVLNADKDGIRLSALRSAGIHTVGQVLTFSPNRLCTINGIGESTASKIYTNAKALETSTAKTITVSLSPEEKNTSSSKLLTSLAVLMQEQDILTQATSLFETHHEKIIHALALTKAATGSLRWLFSNATAKEQAVASIDILESLLEGGLSETVNALSQEHNQAASRRISDPWADFSMNTAPYYALLESIIGADMASVGQKSGTGDLSEDLLSQIEAFEPNLSRLKANLRNYQLFGTKYILHQEKVLLGDEMGLGKTMQAIAAFCHLAAKGGTHFLVVCPLSVVVNWKREIEAQSDLKTIEIYGDDRAMEMTLWNSDGGVAITTFETLNKVPIPQTVNIDMMVVDEAHYIKNPEAIRTQSVVNASRKASRILFMSGTPLENKVEEMNFLIQCLQPSIATQVENMKQLTQAEEYKKAIAPVYLRRVREDVLKELPELIEKEQWCLMNEKEKETYRTAILDNNFMAARQVSWDVSDIKNSTKATRLLEICEEMRESNRKIIVFSFFKTVLEKVSSMLGDYCAGVIDGSVPSDERQKLIDDFGKSKAGSVLVCQIQAGGVGLNIQAASVVIFCEPQIKPSMETQAVARAYRMGQMQSVIVHRLLMQDTVDERVMDILHSKTELFDNFADESVIGEAAMEQIMEEERKQLLQAQ